MAKTFGKRQSYLVESALMPELEELFCEHAGQAAVSAGTVARVYLDSGDRSLARSIAGGAGTKHCIWIEGTSAAHLEDGAALVHAQWGGLFPSMLRCSISSRDALLLARGEAFVHNRLGRSVRSLVRQVGSLRPAFFASLETEAWCSQEQDLSISILRSMRCRTHALNLASAAGAEVLPEGTLLIEPCHAVSLPGWMAGYLEDAGAEPCTMGADSLALQQYLSQTLPCPELLGAPVGA